MSVCRVLAVNVATLVSLLVIPHSGATAQTFKEQNEALLEKIRLVHGLSETQSAALGAIFRASGSVGQGNPAVTRHPLSPVECETKLVAVGARYENESYEKLCRAKYMAPLYDPATERAGNATACIDQFEFPDIPCVYPVVWVRAREAALICQALGKRICDAHEWEGACAGALLPPDYRFDLARGVPPNAAAERMRAVHNRDYETRKTWAYGDHYRQGICASSSAKSAGCSGGSWAGCGSNTFPAGSFPECRSALGVYDLHGNAAEHMNLPFNERQMSSRGSSELGYTEMKGSWFIFDTYPAHPDWCRWRAPFWHGGRVLDEHSHENYHLGFRCCKTIAAE